MRATRPPGGTPRRVNSAAQRCAELYSSPNVSVTVFSPLSLSSVMCRCARSASYCARKRRISLSVCAANIPWSSAARCSRSTVAEERSAEGISSGGRPPEGAASTAFESPSGVLISAATLSGRRTLHSASNRASNSTRSRLPRPSSRSRWEERPSIGRAPSLPSSPSSTRSISKTRCRTAERSSCVLVAATVHRTRNLARGYHAFPPISTSAEKEGGQADLLSALAGA